MENEISKEMIDRFLSNQSSAEEGDKVGDYLQANPEVLDEYFDLCNLTDATEMTSSLSEKQRWQPEERRDLRKRVFRAIDDRAIPVVYRNWLAVACCLIVVCTVYYFWGSHEQWQNKMVVTQQVAPRYLIENNSDTVQEVKLQDGSMVAMQPQTSIYYQDSFQVKRDLYLLHGSALFRVKRNEEHPFTVIADGIGTTALGTVFLVEAGGVAGKKMVSVQLKSGKVLVRSCDAHFELRSRILDPGQTLVVDKFHNKVQLIPAPSHKRGISKRQRGTRKQESSPNSVQWMNKAFRFSDADLGAVFDHISYQFHVVIMANPKIYKGKQFTGTIYNNDDPQMLINTICSMNDLTYIQQGDTLIIQKKR